MSKPRAVALNYGRKISEINYLLILFGGNRMKTRSIRTITTTILILAVLLCGFIVFGAMTSGSAKPDQSDVTVTIDTVSPSKQVTLRVDSTDGYYIISNADELDAFAALAKTNGAVYAKLTANITYNEGDLSTLDEYISGYREYMPAGMIETLSPIYGKTYTVFTGTLDGKGYSISGIMYSKGRTSSLDGYGGIVSRLGSGGVIKNLTVTKSYFADVSFMGAIAGTAAEGSRIENCHNVGTTVRSGRYTGGIVGRLERGTVTGCTNSGKIEWDQVNEDAYSVGHTGGIAGSAIYSGTLVEKCINSGEITSSATITGGIVGEGYDHAVVKNCLNVGFVNSPGTPQNSTAMTGGISGYGNNGIYHNNLCIGKVVGYQTVGHIVGGVIVTDIDMQNNFHCHDITVTREDVQTLWDESLVIGVSESALTSGEVAYKLGEAWGQEIGKDARPVFGGMKVYQNQTGGCLGSGATYVYSNAAAEAVITHIWKDPEVVSASTCITHGEHKIGCQYCTESYIEEAPLDPDTHEMTVSKGFYPCCDAIYDYVNYYENGVVKIRNVEQLQWLARYVAKGNADVSVILWEDFDLSEIDFVPIGTPDHPYSGEFNGNGKTLSGLDITVTSGAGGIFAYTGTATVKDLTVEGKITLDNTSGTNVIDGVGGIVGTARGTTITNCVSYVNISGTAKGGRAVAGIAGGAYNNGNTGTVVTYCANYGNISVLEANELVAGIVGYAQQYGKIDNCANYGNISAEGTPFVAGILGYINNSNFEGVTNCLNIGDIVGGDHTAAIVGRLNDHKANTFKNNYHYSDIIGYDSAKVAKSGETFESFALTEAQMESGMAAYGLNGGATDGVWRQTIGTDAYPTFNSNGKIVYAILGCEGSPQVVGYSNTSGLWDHISFDDKTGACTNCGATTQPAHYNEETGYYEIRNAGQLFWFAEMVNNQNDTYGSINVMLMADIVINSETVGANSTGAKVWTPIGKSGDYYKGIFDGNGKTVSGIYINENKNGSGLFGFTKGATVKNVGVVNAYIFTGYEYGGGINVGGVVAHNNGGTVINCYYVGIVTGYNMVGGVVGQNTGTVENCYAVADVRGDINIGFLVGQNSGATAKNCYYWEYPYQRKNSEGNLYNTPSGGANYGTRENIKKMNDNFATGEVAYLLNSTLAEGNVAWGQKIGTDAYPTFIGRNNAVYYGYESCAENAKRIYTNDESLATQEHNYVDGACSACGAEEPALLGDVSGDGKITNADILAMHQYIYEAELYPIDIKVGDVNGDGKITNADVLAMYRYIYSPETYPLG